MAYGRYADRATISVLTLDEASADLRRVPAEVESVVVGKHAELCLILSGIVAGEHVLLEDPSRDSHVSVLPLLRADAIRGVATLRLEG